MVEVDLYSGSATVLASAALGAGVRLALHPQFVAGIGLLSVGLLIKLSRAWVGVLLLLVLLVTCLSIFSVYSDRIILVVRRSSPVAARAIGKSTVLVAGATWSLLNQAAPWTITLVAFGLPAVTQMAGSFSTIRLLMASSNPQTQIPSAPSLVVTVLVYVFGVKLFGLSRTWLQPSKIAFLLQSFWVARMMMSPSTYLSSSDDTKAIKYLPSVLVGWGGFMLSLMPEGAIMGAIQAGASAAAVAGAAVASVASLQGLKSMGRRNRHGKHKEVQANENDQEEPTTTKNEQVEDHESDQSTDDEDSSNETIDHYHSNDAAVSGDAAASGGGAASALIDASWQHTKASWSAWFYGSMWMWISVMEWGSWVSGMLQGKGALKDKKRRERSSVKRSKEKDERQSRSTRSSRRSSSRSKSASRRSVKEDQAEEQERERSDTSSADSQLDDENKNKSSRTFRESSENTGGRNSKSRSTPTTEKTDSGNMKQTRNIPKLVSRAVAKAGVAPADLSPPMDAAFGVVLLRSFPTTVVVIVTTLSVIIGNITGGKNELGPRSFIPLMLTPFAIAELFMFWSKFVLVYGHPRDSDGSWRAMLPSMFMLDMSMPSKEERRERFPDGMSLLLWEHPKLRHAWSGLMNLSKNDPDAPTGERGDWMLRAMADPGSTAKTVLGSNNALLLVGDVELTNRIWMKLVVSVILDLLGVMSFALPGIGEAADVFFAPFSAFVLMKMYGSSAISWFGFFEELLPFTDIIPTATLSWFYFYGPSLARKVVEQVRGVRWMRIGYKEEARVSRSL